MKATDFVQWLNGFFELSGDDKLDENQVKIVKEHIKLVLETEKSQESTAGSSPPKTKRLDPEFLRKLERHTGNSRRYC